MVKACVLDSSTGSILSYHNLSGVQHLPNIYVFLSFAFMFKFVNAKLGSVLASQIQSSLAARYKTICSDGHILSVVFDPIISTNRYIDLIPLLDNRTVVLIAQKAFEKDISFSEMSSEQATRCVRCLSPHFSGERSFAVFENSFHLCLWWSKIRI